MEETKKVIVTDNSSLGIKISKEFRKQVEESNIITSSNELKKFLETGNYKYIIKSAENKEKIGRNTPCFCGSGKKYKKCHGK